MSLINASGEKSRHISSWSDLQDKRPLPVHFTLYASKRKSQALCPCLILQHDNISIIRILDPEHQEPYISLDSIFLLAGISVPLGLLEFDLNRENGDYDLTLAGLEPREALWAPLQLARKVAEDLGLLQQLTLILDWENRHTWSLDEGDSGLVHNWRTTQLDVASYSTSLLMEMSICDVTLLSKGNMFRTLVSEEQRKEASQRSATILQIPSSSANHLKRFEEKMLRWSVLAHEKLLHTRKSFQSGSLDDDEDDQGQFSYPQNADILQLFRDLLRGLEVDIEFSPVSLKIEEIHSATMQAYQPSLYISVEDSYRDARIQMTLLHYYWTIYMTIIKTKGQAHAKETTTESTPLKQVPNVNEQQNHTDNIVDRLKRLESSTKRTEWALAELITNKSKCQSYNQSDQSTLAWQCQIPLLGPIDSRIFIALIFGILLGSATTTRT